MKPGTHGRTQTRQRGRVRELPLALFHAPRPGEDVDLFSDRNEDALEYEGILHEFEALHDAEMTNAGIDMDQITRTPSAS